MGSTSVVRQGARIVVRERLGTFVKVWGDKAAVVRFDDAPNAPKVVPLARIRLLRTQTS